jgi:hypothetical protein
VEDEARMTAQPGHDFRVFVGGVIVEDHVDHLSGGDFGLDGIQKADELLMAMTLHAAPDDRALQDIERGEQRGRAVADIIVGHGFEPAGLQRQARLGAVERLDLALFVEAEHDGVRRRIDIQPDDVSQLADKLRVVRQLELAHPMRLKPMRAPDALHRRDADAGLDGHRRRRPVRDLAGRVSTGQLDNAGGNLRPQRWNARRTGLVAQQACDAFLHEPLLPAPDRGFALARQAHDLSSPDPLRRQQHDPTSPNVFLWAVPIRVDRFKPAPVVGVNINHDSCAHPKDSHASPTMGILVRTQLLDFIH